MIKTIFWIVMLIAVMALYILMVISILTELKDVFRDELYKKNRLKSSMDIIKSNAKLLKLYTEKQELNTQDKDNINDLYEIISGELYYIEKLFRRGF